MRKYIHKNEFKSIKYSLDRINNSLYENIKYEIFSSEQLHQNQHLFVKSTIKSEPQLRELLSKNISDSLIVQEIINLFALDDDFKIPSHLHKQFLNNRVVLFIGSGVSANAGYPGWWDFAKIAIKKLLKNNMISNQTYSDLLESKTDPKQLLSIFEGVYPKESEEYRNLYIEQFEPRNDDRQIESQFLFDLITDHVFGNKIITTNIDNEIYLAYERNNEKNQKIDDNSDHSKSSINPKIDVDTIYEIDEIERTKFDGNNNKIIHLHGIYKHPEKTIFTLKDYSDAYFKNESGIVKFLEYIFKEYSVLFIGYGLAEFAILESIIKHGKNNYSLEPIFFNQVESLNLKTQAFKNLNINIIPYYRDFNDYSRLKDVLSIWKEKLDNHDFLNENFLLKKAVRSEDVEKYQNDVIPMMERDPSHREYFLKHQKHENWLFILKTIGIFSPKIYPISNYKEGFNPNSIWHQLIYLEDILNNETLSDPIKFLITEIISDILNFEYTNDWVDTMISRILGKLPQSNIKIETLKAHLQKIEDNPYEKQKTEFWSVKKLFYKVIESNDKEKIELISEHLFSFIPKESDQRKRIMRYKSDSFTYEFQDDKFSPNITSESIITVLNETIDILRSEGKSNMFNGPIPIQITNEEYEIIIRLSKLEALEVLVKKEAKTVLSFMIKNFYEKNIEELDKVFREKFNEAKLNYDKINTSSFLSGHMNSFIEILKFLYQENYDIIDFKLIDPLDTTDENDFKNLILIIINILEKLKLSDQKVFKQFINDLFENKHYYFPIFKKVGLYFINKYFLELRSVFWSNITKYHFLDNYKYNDLTYEVLSKNSALITPAKAEKLGLFVEHGPVSYNIENEKERFKYWQLKWYSVLKDKPAYKEKYNSLVKYNNGKDYSHRHKGISYTSSPTSPISSEAMAEMSALDIYNLLISYKSNRKEFNSPDEWGLSHVLKKDSYDNLNKYLDNILIFKNVDYKYLSSITSSIISKIDNSYSDYIEGLIEFYAEIYKSSLQEKISNEEPISIKDSIASEIFALFTTIVKNDNIKINNYNIFTRIIDLGKLVYQYVPTQTYENYITQNGFVTYVLNNPEAKYYKLVFELSLREGRELKHRDHKWKYKQIFQNGFENGLDSIYTLFGLYLDNFMWLDTEWVKERLLKFEVDSNSWKAFIGGFFPRGPIIDESIYSLLKPTYKSAIKNNLEPKSHGGFGISGHIANLYAVGYIPLNNGGLVDLFISEKPNKISSLISFFSKNVDYFEVQEKQEKIRLFSILNNLVNFILDNLDEIENEIKQRILSSALNLLNVFKVLDNGFPDCFLHLSKFPLPLVHRNFSVLENNFESFDKKEYANLLLEISLKMKNIRAFRFDGSDVINIWNYIQQNLDLTDRKEEILILCEKYIKNSITELIEYFQEFAEELKDKPD